MPCGFTICLTGKLGCPWVVLDMILAGGRVTLNIVRGEGRTHALVIASNVGETEKGLAKAFGEKKRLLLSLS